MPSTNTDQKTLAGDAPGARRWRDAIKIHPACELFPPLPDDELRALGEDIRKRGLLSSIALWVPTDHRPVFAPAEDFAGVYLLDGRNRRDACEMAGITVISADAKPSEAITFEYYLAPGHPDADQGFGVSAIDPCAFVISANIRRRHLTTAQKRELIARLLRENPERSDNATGKLTTVSDKTVTRVRRKLEATSEIPKLNHTIGADGRSRPRGRVEAEPIYFYTANPAAPLPALPRAPLFPRTNSAEPHGQERNETIAAIVKHLHRDPTMFLSDVAAILADDQARLARVSIFNRRSALAKIARSLGLPIAAEAWKGK